MSSQDGTRTGGLAEDKTPEHQDAAASSARSGRRSRPRVGRDPREAGARFVAFLTGRTWSEPPPAPGPIEAPVPGKVGVCCSGGGVRSAAYNLGALQVLGEAKELQRASYLSAVSGGAYIAGARSLVYMQTQDKTLFDSLRPYQLGSPEEQWLRNNSSYLAPGLVGKIRIVLRLLTGMGINVVLVGLFLFLLGRPMGWAYGRWLFPHFGWNGPNPFRTIPLWAWLAAVIPAGIGLGFVLFDLIFRPAARRQQFLSSWAGRLFAVAAIPFVLLVLLPYLTLLLQNELGHVGGLVGKLFASKEAEPIAAEPAKTATPGIPGIVWPAIGSLALAAFRILWARKRATVVMAATAIIGPLTMLFTFVWFVNGGALRPGEGWVAWAGLALLFVVIYLFSDLTNWSGHPFYKRRLAAGYSVRRVSNQVAIPVPYSKLSRLSQSQPPGRPELIVCAAANISTLGVTPPGRRAATFTFMADKVGGPLVDYVQTSQFEDILGSRKRDMTLLAAIAVSGAAASPSMGKLTIPPLRFLLGIMGVRLGIWLPNPRWLPRWQVIRPNGLTRRDRPRLHYLAMELFGLNSVNDKFLYVTDGGHFENLGLVELLRRGCTEIYCFDASGEEDNTFYTLGQAVAIARADLKVEIEIDPSPICPVKDADACNDKDHLCGDDHVLGTIRYPQPDGSAIAGTLVYARTAVTTKSPYETRAFRQRDPRFPKHATFDQLFNDEKFEAYWALGRHTARRALGSMDGARKSPGGASSSIAAA